MNEEWVLLSAFTFYLGKEMAPLKACDSSLSVMAVAPVGHVVLPHLSFSELQ